MLNPAQEADKKLAKEDCSLGKRLAVPNAAVALQLNERDHL